MQIRNTMCRYFPFYDNECHCAFSEVMNEKEAKVTVTFNRDRVQISWGNFRFKELFYNQVNRTIFFLLF